MIGEHDVLVVFTQFTGPVNVVLFIQNISASKVFPRIPAKLNIVIYIVLYRASAMNFIGNLKLSMTRRFQITCDCYSI